MKKLIITGLMLGCFCIQIGFAFEWEPYGPEGIKANKLCFFEWNSIGAVACVDTGMYLLSGYDGTSYDYYSYANMEVVEAVSAGFGTESDSILVIMSDGSWSDGIYSFPGESGEFTLLHYCYDPHFILRSMDKYFVGYNNGLLMSEDGITWNDIPYFSGMACIDMTTNFEDFLVATNSDLNNTYFSNGELNTWNQITSDHISELCDCNYFSNYFFGINEGTAGNCGFYLFNTIQESWENVFYSYKLNAVGLSSDGNQFVGWYEGNAPYTGIAKCSTELTYLNDGLPNLNIRAITAPLFYMGGTVVYCCTDNGIYKRILSVGEKENKMENEISVYPNPSSGQVNILVNLPDFNNEEDKILIYNNSGIEVDEIKIENISSQNLEIIWNKGDMPAGVYYLIVKTRYEIITEKFIIL